MKQLKINIEDLTQELIKFKMIKRIYERFCDKLERDYQEDPAKLRLYDFIPVLGQVMYMDRNDPTLTIGAKALFTAGVSIGSLMLSFKGLENLLS